MEPVRSVDWSRTQKKNLYVWHKRHGSAQIVANEQNVRVQKLLISKASCACGWTDGWMAVRGPSPVLMPPCSIRAKTRTHASVKSHHVLAGSFVPQSNGPSVGKVSPTVLFRTFLLSPRLQLNPQPTESVVWQKICICNDYLRTGPNPRQINTSTTTITAASPSILGFRLWEEVVALSDLLQSADRSRTRPFQAEIFF